MNIREFDNMARRNAMIRSGGRCEMCESQRNLAVVCNFSQENSCETKGVGFEECNNEILEDHHIISRGLLLTRWAGWNHLVIGHAHHDRPDLIRKWVEENRPDVWRKMRRCERRRDEGRFREKNMNAKRIRERLTQRCEILCGY